MSISPEKRPNGARQEPLRIKTIGKAAEEIRRLYNVFDSTAVDLTPGYLKSRLDGEVGVTWGMFSGRRVPFLDPIARHNGRIKLGAAVTQGGWIHAPYSLGHDQAFVPDGTGAFQKQDAFSLRRAQVGFDPGEEYVVLDENLLRADIVHSGSVPSVAGDGKFAWSTPREHVDRTYRRMTNVDPKLTAIIEEIQDYEKK